MGTVRAHLLVLVVLILQKVHVMQLYRYQLRPANRQTRILPRNGRLSHASCPQRHSYTIQVKHRHRPSTDRFIQMREKRNMGKKEAPLP